ncbi:MAG: hypothetical protein ACXABY_03425 [Candidatus Thorarchaeota archaeon]|jgi:hypothetical protein
MKHAKQMSRRKIALVLIVVISTSVPMWLLWEFSAQPLLTEEILNYDTRVFTEFGVDSTSRQVSLKGVNGAPLSGKTCWLIHKFGESFEPSNNGYLTVSTQVNLSLELSGSLFGFASVSIGFILLDNEMYQLRPVEAYHNSSWVDTIILNGTFDIEGSFDYFCFANFTYHFAVYLEATLSGLSAIGGFGSNELATMHFGTIDISESV